MKAMILAAGLGTRLRPITDNIPKALVPIAGRPLLEWNLLRLRAAGITEVVVNVHHHARQVVDFLKSTRGFGLTIHISDERQELLETGGGLKKARPFLDGKDPFLLTNVDVLSDLDLKAFLDFHQSRQALVTLAVRNRNSSRKLLFDERGWLAGWRNVKTGELRMARTRVGNLQEMAFSGIHLLNPRIFEYLHQDGPFSIIDAYLDLASQEVLLAYPHDETQWLDVGRPESLPAAERLVTNWAFDFKDV